MEQYKTDAEIYEVLEREIIDLTIRPGSSLSENPLCARFGAPRTLIRVVLQKLQENGLVKIVPYKGTTVTRLNREIVDELIYERTAVEARVLRDFVEEIHSLCGGNGNLEYGSFVQAKEGALSICPVNENMKKLTGGTWKEQVSFAEGIRRMLP